MKKGIVIASAVAAAMVLAGCSHPQPMPQQNQSMQTAPGGKLGNHCKGHHCKGNNCNGNSCNTYNGN